MPTDPPNPALPPSSPLFFCFFHSDIDKGKKSDQVINFLLLLLLLTGLLLPFPTSLYFLGGFSPDLFFLSLSIFFSFFIFFKHLVSSSLPKKRKKKKIATVVVVVVAAANC